MAKKKNKEAIVRDISTIACASAMIPLCLNCLSILNVYGGCDKCNRLLLKEIEENYGES